MCWSDNTFHRTKLWGSSVWAECEQGIFKYQLLWKRCIGKIYTLAALQIWDAVKSTEEKKNIWNEHQYLMNVVYVDEISSSHHREMYKFWLLPMLGCLSSRQILASRSSFWWSAETHQHICHVPELGIYSLSLKSTEFIRASIGSSLAA